jgi:hypothetical protein
MVSVVLSIASSAAAADPPTCNQVLPNTKVYGSIVNAIAKKSWQPRGGEFTFDIETPTIIPNDALITVCFGWKLRGEPTDPKGFIESRPTRIVKLEPDHKSMTIAATVPDLRPAPPLFRGDSNVSKDPGKGKQGVYRGFGMVPVADVRILVYQPSGEAVLDVLTTVGVTKAPWAALAAFAAVAIALVLLYCCSRIRQPQLAGANPLLRIIASERNYASLSQAQIILWTLVVGASAVYVMALSGDLIDITGGTLTLLGISGAASVAAKWKSAIDDQKKPAPPPTAGAAGPGPAAPPPAVPAPVAPAPGAAVAAAVVPPVPPKALPEWSDLVISLERVDGNFVQTIDVTRVQMLFFTLITAAFVVLKVVTSYEIPPIPDGFMTLMGISNGVYLGSKFVK